MEQIFIIQIMGNQHLSQIQNKYGQNGIDYLLHQYEVTKARGSVISPSAPASPPPSTAQQDDMRYITNKREQLQAHYNIEKQTLDKNYPGALSKATKSTGYQAQQLLGLEDQLKKIDKKRQNLAAEYSADASKQSTLYRPPTLLQSLPQYDNLPPKYKLDVLEDAYNKYGGGHSNVINPVPAQPLKAGGGFNKLNKLELDKEVEQGKRNITHKAKDLAGNQGCCHCCCCCR